MKAQLSEAALLGAAKSMLNGVTKSDAVGRIGKNKTSGGVSAKDTEEMQIYFSKLKELVPFMPRNRKLSKLEIIQYVIDYICDLQLALEAHPASSSSTITSSVSSKPNAVAVAGGSSSSSTSSSSSVSSPSSNNNRQPLGVIANVTSNLSNTCAAQEAHHEKLPSHLEELNTRPVSC